MSNELLADIPQAQPDRFAFVESRVRFFGDFRRQSLVSRCAIESALASGGLALYHVVAPGNFDFDCVQGAACWNA